MPTPWRLASRPWSVADADVAGEGQHDQLVLFGLVPAQAMVEVAEHAGHLTIAAQGALLAQQIGRPVGQSANLHERQWRYSVVRSKQLLERRRLRNLRAATRRFAWTGLLQLGCQRTEGLPAYRAVQIAV